jgi:hypothetical protein
MKLALQMRLFLLSVTMLLTAFFSIKAAAQGNLLLTPGRVIFEGQKKMQELNLANTGRDTARYLVSFVEIRMKEDGGFEQITEPDSGQHFASNYLRFFPRSVILAPGEAQVVKVQLTKTSQLVTGEYRSHIYFRAVPDEEPLGEKIPAQEPSGISVRLTPVFGITIPVIIRIGESTAAVSLSNAAFEMSNDSVPILNIVFNRTGNMSVYGDLTIDFISSKGKVTQVSEIKGIAVYTPTPSRRIRVALGKFSGIDYKTGKLHAVYKTSSDAKSVKIAETELALF